MCFSLEQCTKDFTMDFLMFLEFHGHVEYLVYVWIEK